MTPEAIALEALRPYFDTTMELHEGEAIVQGVAAAIRAVAKARDAALLQNEQYRIIVSSVDNDHHLTPGGERLNKHDACGVCLAIERLRKLVEGPGACCEGYAKYCDAHSIGCVFADKQQCDSLRGDAPQIHPHPDPRCSCGPESRCSYCS